MAQRSCHITTHNDDEVYGSLWELTNRKKVKAVVVNFAVENQLIKRYMKVPKHFICSNCIENIISQLANPPKRHKSQDSGVPSGSPRNEHINDCVFERVSELLYDDVASVEQLNILCRALGTKIRRELLTSQCSTGFGLEQKSTRLDDIYVGSYDKIWNNQPNTALKQLLNSVADNENRTNENCRKMFKCAEIIRSLVDTRYISNTSLGEALVMMQYSHSKNAVEFLNKIVPTGSYSLLRNTIAALGSDKKSLPENDIIISFDNVQVVPKTWSIKYMGKQATSTVTSLVYYDQGPSSKFQYELDIPTALFMNQENRKELISRYVEFSKSAIETHRGYRKKFIESCLAKVIDDCVIKNGVIQDTISCDATKPMFFFDSFDYTRVQSTERVTPITDLDCLNLNPSSYDAVGKVLDSILNYMKDSPRKYVTTTMDGSPYGLSMKLIAETYLCSICEDSVSSSNMTAHEQQHSAKVSWSRKYKKILTRPGNGHVEMTIVKTILGFFWTPFLKPVARLHGFESEGSLEYIKKGYDHHKAYNLLMIALGAYSYELIYPYVRDELLNQRTPTYNGFCIWASKKITTNKTFNVAMDFTFTVLHGLQLFRSAIRRCNDEVSLQARHQLSSLFYISSNTKYQQYMCHDTLFMISLPKQKKTFVQMESSRTTSQGAGEGFDFLLENRNKLYKSFLPESTPSFKTWLQVTRTASELEKLRGCAAERLGLDWSKTSNEFQNKRFDKEIHEVRKYLRSLKIFDSNDLGFVTVDESRQSLDESWLDFVSISTKNQDLYTSAYTKNEKIRLPVFTLAVSDPDLNTAGIPEIKAAIDRKILALNEPFQQFYKTNLKFKTSLPELKEFYDAIMNQLLYQLHVDLSFDLEELFCLQISNLDIYDDDDDE